MFDFRSAVSNEFECAENQVIVKRSPLANELGNEKCSPLANELDATDLEQFLRVGFTMHIDIIAQTEIDTERWFYIRKVARDFIGKRQLHQMLTSDLYHQHGSMPSNFALMLVKLPEENPSIGILLCRDKDNTEVEFTLRDMSKPMGVATYRSSQELPEQYRNALPSAEDLKRLL